MAQYYIVHIIGEGWTTMTGLWAESVKDAIAKSGHDHMHLWATGDPDEQLAVQVFNQQGEELPLPV